MHVLAFSTGTSIPPALEKLKNLKRNRWIDRSTRLMVVEMSFYNMNTELMASVQLLSEFSIVGVISPTAFIIPFKYVDHISAFRGIAINRMAKTISSLSSSFAFVTMSLFWLQYWQIIFGSFRSCTSCTENIASICSIYSSGLVWNLY